MISHDLLISFISGAVVILALSLLQKGGFLNKRTAALLGFVLLFVGNLYYYGYIVPQQRHEAKLAAAENDFAALPVWRTIKTQKPVLYQKLQQEFVSALNDGVSEQQALERLRPMLADLLKQRIRFARDEDIVRYMQVSVEEMKILRQKSDDACFRFLFPQVSGGINITEHLPQPLIDDEMAAMNSFLLHSQGEKIDVDIMQGRDDLQTIVHSLYGKWGGALQSLNTPTDAGADKAKLCDMTIDLYQSVLALPVKNAAEVLRIILDGNAG